MPASNGSIINHDNNKNISKTQQEQTGSDTPFIDDQQEKITAIINRRMPCPMITVTDVDLETELANLVYGHPENDYKEAAPIAPTFKSSEV